MAEKVTEPRTEQTQEQTTGEIEASRESGYGTMAFPSSRVDSMPVPIPRASSTEAADHQQVPSLSHSVSVQGDDDDDDDNNDDDDNDNHHPNFAMYGAEESARMSEVNEGKGESCEVVNREEKPLNDAVFQEETQATAAQEETQTGASMQQERVIPQSSPQACTEMVTGDKPKSILVDVNKERSKKICKAVSEYYMNQFVAHWKTKTKQECGKIKVIAALLIEKVNKIKVVALTAGTKHKTECSYFVKQDSIDADDHESSWGLCDGHAEAVCYRLASVYLMTEIYKLHDGEDSIFEETSQGYALKPKIHFHLFTSHPPCGFMANTERHLLSWKQPFKGKPHSLQCSSQILISAYLGIQGSLSHLLVSPIYVSSVTIPRYETFPSLHGTYIRDRLQEFKNMLPDSSESEYRLHIPHVEILKVDVLKLFPECFRPYTYEKPSNLSTGDEQLPQQETTIVAKETDKGAKKMAFAAPDVIGNRGINAMVFTLDDGIGSEEFRKSVQQLKSKLIQVPIEVKQRRLKSLQDARIRLSQAINVSEALGVLKKLIIKKIEDKYTERCRKAEVLIPLLMETKDRKTNTEHLKAQVCRLQDGLGKAMKTNDLKSIVSALNHNLDFQVMLDDLENLLEEEKSHSSDPEFYLELMGCNWVRYMKTIQDDIK